MTSEEMAWQPAIIAVLQDAGEPLHYQKITELIGERELRTLSGANPANSVSGFLSQMTNEDHPSFNDQIQRVTRGVYMFVDPESPMPDSQQDINDIDDAEEEQDETSAQKIVKVPAFGLYWERDKVNWGRGSKGILGRQTPDTKEVDFSEQQGVYLLHKDRSVIYVGRATKGSLRERLKFHKQDKKAPRWNRFSWFGLRDVNDETGELEPLPSEIDTDHFVAILESVLIEALEPPVNGQRGDYMGILYEQVVDPEIQEKEDAKLRRMMAESLYGGIT